MRVKIEPTGILDPMFQEGVTVENKFLSKDTKKALEQVTEILYDRLAVLRQCVPDAGKAGFEPDDVERQMMSEMDFVSNVLDVIERS